MTNVSDADLLQQYSRDNSGEAFAAIVERHISLVHSVALRHTSNPQQAEDITQAVFIILARKAGTLNRKIILPGWLYHTARLTAANFQRAEIRRAHRENEAYMQSTLQESGTDPLWPELGPLLDEAMSRLGANERDVLVLRYFQNKTLSEVGVAMGLEDRTAQKRVSRALEKLRKYFSKRGVDFTAECIAVTISTHSVVTAPAVLAKSVSVIAVSKGAAATTSTLTLIKGALKIMAWTQAKTAIVAGVGVVLAATTLTVAVKTIQHAHSNRDDISSPTSPFRDTSKYVSPFTMVQFDPADSNKVTVAYEGLEYQLAAVNGLSVTDIMDFCRHTYGQAPFGESWAEKRLTEDLVVVLSDMGHATSPDNMVSLTLIDPQSGQQQIVPHALMTGANRGKVVQSEPDSIRLAARRQQN